MKVKQTSRFLLLCAILAFGFGSHAWAFTLKQRKFIKGQMVFFKMTMASTNKRCTSNFKGSIDWKSFRSRIGKKPKVSPYNSCAHPLNQLYRICVDKIGKQTVRQKIKRYVCRFGGKGKRNLTFKRGVLTYTVDFTSKLNTTYLKKKLGDML